MVESLSAPEGATLEELVAMLPAAQKQLNEAESAVVAAREAAQAAEDARSSAQQNYDRLVAMLGTRAGERA